MSVQAWRAMSQHFREVLVSLATDRKDPARAALQGWLQFTEAERISIGCMARQWRRETAAAEWLR